MSVRVADLLKIPCFRDAKVLAGKKGLSKVVTSVSVLEYADIDETQDAILNNIEFYGSELVITAFANIKDNIELQCENIRRLAAVGEVGLILYYVGIILPKVSKELIELSDELDFVLICMPENRYDLRYSEVIVEVMDAIFKDRMAETHFENEILEQLLSLQVYQRNVDTVMKMLSDRTRSGLILKDKRGETINHIFWPRTFLFDLDELVFKAKQGLGQPAKIELSDNRFWTSFIPIILPDGTKLELFIIKQDEPVPPDVIKQIYNVLRLSINLWSHGHGRNVVSELVLAILQDEPVKMRRLAELFDVDVASLNSMWVIVPDNKLRLSADWGTSARNVLAMAQNVLKHRCKNIVSDIYDNDIVIFMDDANTPGEWRIVAASLIEDLVQSGMPGLTLATCFHLANTTEARNAFLLIKDNIETAIRIYPHRMIFTYPELKFAEECRRILDAGEQVIQEKSAILAILGREDRLKQQDLCDMLTIYMLDTQFDLAETAKLMFLHKNTIKYRLNRIEEQLCCQVDKMP